MNLTPCKFEYCHVNLNIKIFNITWAAKTGYSNLAAPDPPQIPMVQKPPRKFAFFKEGFGFCTIGNMYDLCTIAPAMTFSKLYLKIVPYLLGYSLHCSQSMIHSPFDGHLSFNLLQSSGLSVCKGRYPKTNTYY